VPIEIVAAARISLHACYGPGSSGPSLIRDPVERVSSPIPRPHNNPERCARRYLGDIRVVTSRNCGLAEQA
jgi:hypothetical protein